MSLRQQQSKFVLLIADLIRFAYKQGFEITFGDAWAREGHKKDSFHYKRLAVDLNLFKDGKYLYHTEDHQLLGEYWESLDSQCTWGGRFKNKDGNHYSFGEI